MTAREFEDRLDECLRSWVQDADSNASFTWPSDVIQAIETAPEPDRQERARQARTLLWLHRQVRQAPLPLPAAGFAQRVAEEFRRTSLEESRQVVPFSAGSSTRTSAKSWRARSVFWVAGSLATAVAVATLLILRPASRQQLLVQAPAPSQVQVAPPQRIVDPIRDAGGAYLALVRQVGDALGGVASVEPSDSDAKLTKGRDRAPRTELAVGPTAPRVGQVITESTGAVLDAGDDLRGAIRPVTDSAIGAFSFLWKEAPTGGKRSI